MSDLTQRIAQLSTEERIRLEERLLAARKNGSSQRIPRRAESGPAPLSFTQERLWFLAQLEPDSPAYNETQVYRLTGPLNIPALERSLDALAARHDSLRVCFREMGDGLVQVAEPLPPTYLNVADLTAIPADQQMDVAWQQIDTARAAIFDLTSPPLWRVFLIRLADDDHIFVRIAHHIISDGWSGSIFWRELRHFYAALALGNEPSPLPELPVSYADYAVWQRERLQGTRLAELVDYWRNRLSGVEPLNLPTNHPRPAQPSHRGALIQFQLNRELSDSLSGLARTSGASLYMLLLTAFQLLLHRYSGQDDIAVGSPIANRGRAEIEGLYGFFVNTLVMRADCGGNPTFRSLLAQVRQNALAAYAHQELPFEKLVEEVHPVRDMRRNPLYDVMFALQNVPRADVGLAGTVMQRLERSATSSKFDLSLFLYERDGTIDGRLEYATDLFDAPTIQRMIGHFQTLLAGIAADPDSLIAELPLLSAAERQQILVGWNQTAADYPADKTIHQLFAEQAARTPDALAISDGERRLTYRELDESANRLAHHLLSLGVQPGEAVGVCLERSANLIVALLAILKAGGVYVPLEQTAPTQRLRFLASDAGLPICTASTEFIEQNSLPDTLSICDVDAVLATSSAYTALQPVATSSHAAYVMYTSGSTGTPKGVLIPHSAVVSLVRNSDYLSITPADIVAHASNPAFDAATFEIWGALLNGATLAVLEQEILFSARRLAQKIEQSAITTLFLTTALFNQLIEEYPATFTKLNTLLFGGEAVSPRHVAICLRAGGPRRLLHVYGPTETTTFATWHSVSPAEAEAGIVPIGRPLANKTAYILDNHLQPVPIGVPGELYVGGAGLALGYLNRPDLTAERFLPHPFSDEAGARLYRTGDLARYREDGVIEFLGRVDRQVKIRGFRVEPGEIEAALRLHPAVRDGVVGVLEDERLGKRLVAWWIGRSAVATDAASLRDFLRQRLPDYMLPTAFVPVAELPLTPNGKIDLRALPAPDFDTRPVAPASPQTPLETQLLSIWRRVLALRSLGVDDNFFDVGGHSLLAVRLMAKVAKATGQELPVASLFYGPTIREQAALIEQKGWSPPWTSLVPVQPAGTRPPLFLVPPAAATAIRFRKFADYLGTNQPLYSFNPLGTDQKTQPLTSIEEIAAHYIGELQKVIPDGPYLLGGMCFGAHVAFEMARQLDAQGYSIPTVLVFDASQPSNGPTWRLARRTLGYYWNRLQEFQQQKVLVNRLQRSIVGRWKQMHLRLRRRLGVEMKKMEPVRIASLEAQLTYNAQVFPGRIVLFQSDEFARYSLQDGWNRLGLDGTETIFFPNTTHRSLLLEDENVERIAEKLREVIDRWMAEHWQDRAL